MDLQNKYLIDVEMMAKKAKLNAILKDYSFYFVSDENFNISLYLNTYQNLIESDVLIADLFISQKQEEKFYILGFKNTVIIIKGSLSIIQSIFSLISKASIYYLSKIKDNLQQQVKINNKIEQIELNLTYLNEIKNFNKEIIKFKVKSAPIQGISSCILSCITGYLIQKSYIKSQLKSLFHIEFQKFSDKTYDENDFIELRNIGLGSAFSVSLNYEIENCQLLAIKKPIGNNYEHEKLSTREYNNYLNTNYLLLPKLYGKIKNGNLYNLVIQFIDGSTILEIIENQQILHDTKKIHLKYNDKIIIIFQLILVINYFHKNKLQT